MQGFRCPKRDLCSFLATGGDYFFTPRTASFAANCTGWDFQAAIIRHPFEQHYPISDIVHSGNKSFACLLFRERPLRGSYQEAHLADVGARF